MCLLGRGEVCALYLLEAYQRQGLGARLTVAVVGHLIAVGDTSMLV
jgi:ribosomal protein S18 acetylase RimI-like enzyme